MLNPEMFIKGALNCTLRTGEGALFPRLSSYCQVPLNTGLETSFGIFQMRVREILSNSQEPPGGSLLDCEFDEEEELEESAFIRLLSFDCIEPFTPVALEPRCRWIVTSSNIATPPGPTVHDGAREIVKDPPASPVVMIGRIRNGSVSFDLPDAFVRAYNEPGLELLRRYPISSNSPSGGTKERDFAVVHVPILQNKGLNVSILL